MVYITVQKHKLQVNVSVLLRGHVGRQQVRHIRQTLFSRPVKKSLTRVYPSARSLLLFTSG